MNDPAIAGLGFDVYQVPATFQAVYRPADGLYHSVVEPPEEHLRDLADYLAKVRLTLGKGRTNPHLRTLISGGRDGREKTVRRRKGMDTGSRVRACLKAGLPAGLKNDRAFMDMFDDAGRVAQFDVSPADELGSEPRGYVLHAFYRSATDSATILIETDPEDGSFSQATWLDEGETYPRVSRREAVRTARESTRLNSRSRRGRYRIHGVRLVWSEEFGTSRFHPSYSVALAGKDRINVIVHPDGRVWGR